MLCTCVPMPGLVLGFCRVWALSWVCSMMSPTRSRGDWNHLFVMVTAPTHSWEMRHSFNSQWRWCSFVLPDELHLILEFLRQLLKGIQRPFPPKDSLRLINNSLTPIFFQTAHHTGWAKKWFGTAVSATHYGACPLWMYSIIKQRTGHTDLKCDTEPSEMEYAN